MTKKLRIEGKHVILSNFLEEDITDIYLNWLNDPEVVKFTAQRFIKNDYLSCKKYFDSFKGTNNLFFTIKLAKSNQMIGTMTAHFSLHGTVDVGIMIGEKSKWSHGYGKDSWNTLLLWLTDKMNIRKITAGTLAINFGMQKLCEDSGMILEAVKKDHHIVDNKTVDFFYYCKFNCEYK